MLNSFRDRHKTVSLASLAAMKCIDTLPINGREYKVELNAGFN